MFLPFVLCLKFIEQVSEIEHSPIYAKFSTVNLKSQVQELLMCMTGIDNLYLIE